jgi:uncharacterized protein involved in exopolysaccharide biosynthesis
MFDGYQYVAHLRARWRLPAVVLFVGLAASLTISLLMPEKYTATVSLVIEPPAGSDPRVSTAVSPIYLESLRTYEHFASSDQLFAQAVDRFQLRSAGSLPIEEVKGDVLRVSIPRNTKVLEIEATLTDPKRAHDLALYIAEGTVKLNRTTNRAGDDEVIANAENDVDAATARLKAAEAAYRRVTARAPSPESLRAELEQLSEMRTEVSRLALSAELAVAEQEDYEKSLTSGGDRRDVQLAGARERLRTLRGRAERLRRQAANLEDGAASMQKLLAKRTTETGAAEAELTTARSVQEQAAQRLRDLEATAGYRGERLNLLDPGVVPEQPSSPNIPLNVLVAAALAVIVSLLYLSVEFSLRTPRAEAVHETPWMASKP